MDTKKMLKTIKAHLWGPVGSVLIHVLIIVAVIKIATTTHSEKTSEISVNMMEIKPMADVEKIKTEIEKIRKPEDVPETPDKVVPPDMNDVSSAVDNNSNAGGESVGLGFGGATGFGTAAGETAAFDVASDANSPLVMRGLYSGRSSGGRGSALSKYGGAHGLQTEKAVTKALEWLKNHQNADGSWGPNTMAMTGLAILTYLAHGETTGSKLYGNVVRRAIDFLGSHQKPDGAFYGGLNTSGKGGDSGVYEHGIATYAISEAYGLCRIPELKEKMEKAAKIIVDNQQPGGLWNYGYIKTERKDLSVSGWQVQALKAAFLNGAEVPGIHEAIEKSVAGLKSMQSGDNGDFGYSDPGKGNGNDAMSGIGVLCLQLIGHPHDKEVALGIKALADTTCDWKDPKKWPLYSWYYITQAKFQQGGATWNGWNSRFAPTLTKNQSDDGHWDSPSGAAAENEESKQGPVYSTCLAALTLQVYYRFLPTYAPAKVEEKKEEKKEEVHVDIT